MVTISNLASLSSVMTFLSFFADIVRPFHVNKTYQYKITVTIDISMTGWQHCRKKSQQNLKISYRAKFSVRMVCTQTISRFQLFKSNQPRLCGLQKQKLNRWDWRRRGLGVRQQIQKTNGLYGWKNLLGWNMLKRITQNNLHDAAIYCCKILMSHIPTWFVATSTNGIVTYEWQLLFDVIWRHYCRPIGLDIYVSTCNG